MNRRPLTPALSMQRCVENGLRTLYHQLLKYPIGAGSRCSTTRALHAWLSSILTAASRFPVPLTYGSRSETYKLVRCSVIKPDNPVSLIQ